MLFELTEEEAKLNTDEMSAEELLKMADLITIHDIVDRKLRALELPGTVIDFDPDEAELAGCFLETALSREDAWEARYDLNEVNIKYLLPNTANDC